MAGLPDIRRVQDGRRNSSCAGVRTRRLHGDDVRTRRGPRRSRGSRRSLGPRAVAAGRGEAARSAGLPRSPVEDEESRRTRVGPRSLAGNDRSRHSTPIRRRPARRAVRTAATAPTCSRCATRWRNAAGCSPMPARDSTRRSTSRKPATTSACSRVVISTARWARRRRSAQSSASAGS